MTRSGMVHTSSAFRTGRDVGQSSRMRATTRRVGSASTARGFETSLFRTASLFFIPKLCAILLVCGYFALRGERLNSLRSENSTLFLFILTSRRTSDILMRHFECLNELLARNMIKMSSSVIVSYRDANFSLLLFSASNHTTTLFSPHT